MNVDVGTVGGHTIPFLGIFQSRITKDEICIQEIVRLYQMFLYYIVYRLTTEMPLSYRRCGGVSSTQPSKQKGEGEPDQEIHLLEYAAWIRVKQFINNLFYL
jgi:hypothetical protein